MLIRRAIIAVSLGMLFAIAGCTVAGVGIDNRLAADLSYIKIVGHAPSLKCRYLGETLSFYLTTSLDLVGEEDARKSYMEFELRKKAKQRGANVVYTQLDYNTGFSYKVLVHTFHAC